VVCRTSVEVLAIDLVISGTFAEEGVGTWFIEVELGGASRPRKGKAWTFHPLPCVLLQLDSPVRQEQGGILLLYLRHVSLPTVARRKAVVLGPVASPTIVVAGVIPGHLALAGGTAITPT